MLCCALQRELHGTAIFDRPMSRYLLTAISVAVVTVAVIDCIIYVNTKSALFTTPIGPCVCYDYPRMPIGGIYRFLFVCLSVLKIIPHRPSQNKHKNRDGQVNAKNLKTVRLRKWLPNRTLGR